MFTVSVPSAVFELTQPCELVPVTEYTLVTLGDTTDAPPLIV